MSEYSAQFTDEKALAKAESFGCTVEYSDERTLQIDLDSRDDVSLYERFDLLVDLGLLLAEDEPVFRLSKSGNKHVTIKLREPLAVEQRILLQALLGSDVKREALALAGFRAGTQKNPILLFRPTNPVGEAVDVLF